MYSLDALKPLGLSLTGPYDVLGGKLDASHHSWEECVLHGRHFFDPPELQTVIMDNEDDGFHIGYFRSSISQFNVVAVTIIICSVHAHTCTNVSFLSFKFIFVQ